MPPPAVKTIRPAMFSHKSQAARVQVFIARPEACRRLRSASEITPTRSNTMSKTHNKGTRVSWKWGDGHGHGVVSEHFTDRVTRTIAGTEVTRDADTDNPAYLIDTDKGDRVLKSHSELSKLS